MVPALGPVIHFVQIFYHGITLPLRYLPLVPHQLGRLVELSEHGRVMVQSELEEFDREFISLDYLRVRDRHMNAVSSPSFGSTSRACVTDLCEGLLIMSSLSLSDLALRRASKNRTPPPRISPGFRSTLPSSSRMYGEITIRVS